MTPCHAPAACLLLLLAGSAGAEPPPVRPVLVATVHYTAQDNERTLPGVIRARIESDLGFRVAGKVIRRAVDVGRMVQPGEVLAELDPVDLEHAMQSADAELRAARFAEASAHAELARIAALRQRGWSTPSDQDRQTAISEDAQGRLSRAEQAVAMARNALDYGTLRADAPGVVTATLAEPGQVVAQGQTVLRVARLDEKEAAVAVPEIALPELRTGSARVVLWALPGRDYPASLRELSPNADTVTRTYAARFTLLGAGSEVMLGMTATVVLANAGPRVARLPLAAILDTGDGPSVWVVDADGTHIARRGVVVARFGADAALVVSGVAEGERVVALGAQKLDPAMRVRAVTKLGS